MKIPAKVYPQGGIDCLSETCPFKRECANHHTAGQFRNEDGFTPRLFEENGQIFCATIKAEAQYNEKTRETLPAKYNSMQRGSLYFDQNRNFKRYGGPFDG